MTISRREKVLLGVLAGLVVIALGVLGGDGDGGGPQMSDTERAKLKAQRARARARSGIDGSVGTSDRVVALDLSSLEPKSGSFEVGRNPFRYAPKPRPKPQPKPPPEPEPEPEPIDPGPPEPQPPSTAHLQYLGRFGPDGRPIAVVVSGEQLYNLTEGETLEQEFVVDEIGYESIAIGFVEFPDTPARRLPVGG